MIAIHHKKEGFSSEWIRFCEKNGIPYKLVNCYDSNIISQLQDCDALMWHFHHNNPRDVLFAKQLHWSLEEAGKVVFPNFRTSWHFDDKVGQKYLFEAVGSPLVPSYVFYERSDAQAWAEKTTYPKVFKLRRGSSSDHVRLVRNKRVAMRLIKKAFSSGFSQYNAISSLKERWRKFVNKQTGLGNLLKGVARLIYPTDFARTVGRERGYIYFQDYIPGMEYDIRITVVGNRAFASKRLVRKNDFRASGSGYVTYGNDSIPPKALDLAFETSEKLGLQSAAFDMVIQDKKPFILEVSYGFGAEESDLKHGYWDRNLNWHKEPFNRPVAIIENIIREIGQRRKSNS